MKHERETLIRPGAVGLLFAGVCFGILGTLLWVGASRDGGADGLWRQSGFLRIASADLEDGEYTFFPNRRNVWVVNRVNGRMASYHFRTDELQSIDRSRVATIDLKTFPREDTVIQLSDRNLNNILWVGNTRTGDVQMWRQTRDGSLEPMGPIPTSTDLMERTASNR